MTDKHRIDIALPILDAVSSKLPSARAQHPCSPNTSDGLGHADVRHLQGDKPFGIQPCLTFHAQYNTDVDPCPPHHWKIGRACGPFSLGQCKKGCGATRWFNNSLVGYVHDLRSGANFTPSQPMTLAYLARTCHVWEQE